MTSTWSESLVLAEIQRAFESLMPIGARNFLDDGAWLPPCNPDNTRVVSCDAFQENNDFILGVEPLDSVGHRAIVQNLSDLAAMGATPVGFVWSLEIPLSWLDGSPSFLSEFCRGAATVCKEFALPLYGGDISLSSQNFGCTITIFGDVEKKVPLSRQGASPGDLLYIGKSLGFSAFGLKILLKDRPSLSDRNAVNEYVRNLTTWQKMAIFEHLYPTPQIELAKHLLPIATSCTDISDGLSRDLHRICRASAVGAQLQHLSNAAYTLSNEKDWRDLVLFGGEDYALLFTIRAQDKKRLEQLSQKYQPIYLGTIIAAPIAQVSLLENGLEILVPDNGFDHFSSSCPEATHSYS